MKSVFDESFAQYGKIIDGYDFSNMLSILNSTSEKPSDSVVYVPSSKELEKDTSAKYLQDNVYGGMPIQIGYCNGNNHLLNCLEYHRNCEIDIAADDIILLVAPLQKVKNYKLDTKEVEAFLCPKGSAVQLYETTLHYAPCTASSNNGFRVAIVLPEGTNTDKPQLEQKCKEDKLLFAKNKWLLALEGTNEAKSGAWIGLCGKNIEV